MNHKVHNQIVNFIWSIADDELRDVFVRGKYRDIILPFTVLRRLDALLKPTKEEVLEGYEFLKKEGMDDEYNKDGLTNVTDYPFYNTSKFTMTTLYRGDVDGIDDNLASYLDGFSPNVQEIIGKFKLRNQLETLKEAGVTYSLLGKFVSNDINLSHEPSINTKGEKLPALTNLGMGYVFEELIRKFNEENNEEAGEHFTPRDIIQLMTNILFIPIKDQLKGSISIYDPACGSGGMLTESEKFAQSIAKNKLDIYLFGQEVNPETYAICTADMLIKDKEVKNIHYGSTLRSDGFPDKKFAFMLTNPPYGKSWKTDYDYIVEPKKKQIIDDRFKVGVPRSSDGQLLFLSNMVSKMAHHTHLGSRIASVHNGSALFTGDAGGGESEIRKSLIESDYLECIIGLPKNMFYNTGISTYIFILSNRKKGTARESKVQLIDASDLYDKMRKSLGNKSHELTAHHLQQITQLYLDFKETPHSKIFDNEDLGYWKITVEQPLRLAAQFSANAIAKLRYVDALQSEMEWIYQTFGETVYTGLDKKQEERIGQYLETNALKINAKNKKRLSNAASWKAQKVILEMAEQLLQHFGDKLFMDFNVFQKDFNAALKKLQLKPTATQKKQILKAISWRDEQAAKVVKKKEKNGTVHYEPDSELRDTENIPLKEDIQKYFEREVIPHVPDAWIDHKKTTKGYEVSFTKYFYQYEALRSLEEIVADIQALERETDGLLEDIISIKK